MCFIPLQVLVNLSVRAWNGEWNLLTEAWSEAEPGTGLNTLVLLVGAPTFTLRMVMWFFTGGRQAGFFSPYPDPKPIPGLPPGAESLRTKHPLVDTFRFPDLGLSSFGAFLFAMWAATLSEQAASSPLVHWLSLLLSWAAFYIIGDYTLLVGMKYELEGRVPPGVLRWRLRFILALCVVAIVLGFLVAVWVGIVVCILVLPGACWVFVHLWEVLDPMTHVDLCKQNPQYAKNVLNDAIAAFQGLAVEDERQSLDEASKVLNGIADTVIKRAKSEVD
jgi:hypothetical protein